LPEDVGHDAAALAARARQEYGSALGLGVGATRSGPDGRPVIDIVLESAGETSRIVHVLGGGPALARVRTAKAALDLVRRTLLAGESPAARAQGVSR
jgi:hypothetical protein